jgi:transcriptional regulator GlxA family with amidase domain
VPAASPDPHPAEVPGAPAAADPADPADPALAAALAQAMDVQQAWRDEDLSVAGLASRLGVPEYRLRRHINQHLGHRNFNAYVNGLRLAEAQRLLADAGQRDTPVLRIALDAGFGSIGPFNRAFKAATGLTPTEFRRQTLAES